MVPKKKNPLRNQVGIHIRLTEKDKAMLKKVLETEDCTSTNSTIRACIKLAYMGYKKDRRQPAG